MIFQFKNDCFMEDGRVFDTIRGRYLKATPEELVRQNVIQWLETNGIAAASIGREVTVMVSGRPLRSDIVVFSKDAKPALVIECKAPSVAISEKVLLQVFEYNKELKAKYVMVTNGNESFCFVRRNEKFVQFSDTSGMFQSILA